MTTRRKFHTKQNTAVDPCTFFYVKSLLTALIAIDAWPWVVAEIWRRNLPLYMGLVWLAQNACRGLCRCSPFNGLRAYGASGDTCKGPCSCSSLHTAQVYCTGNSVIGMQCVQRAINLQPFKRIADLWYKVIAILVHDTCRCLCSCSPLRKLWACVTWLQHDRHAMCTRGYVSGTLHMTYCMV